MNVDGRIRKKAIPRKLHQRCFRKGRELNSVRQKEAVN